MAVPLSIALLLALVLGFPAPAASQTVPDCTKWAVEVCEAPLNYRTDIYGDQGCTDNCYRVYYHFYLIRVGAENNTSTDQSFIFTSLSVTGTLSVAPAPSSAAGIGLSEVNVAQSVAGSTVLPGLNNSGIANCPVLGYDAQSNQITYQVSSNNPSQPVLNWSVYGRLPLFVLAVDVYPGETVQPTGLGYNFTLTNANGSNPVICSNQPTVCTGSDLYKTIAAPTVNCASSAGAPTLRIGSAENAAAPGFPNRKRMPVWVDGPDNTSFSWTELDFLMTVLPGQSMLAPTITGGLIAASSVQAYPAGIPTGSEYRIYAHHRGAITIQTNTDIAANANNTLFFIVFDGPQLESECANVTVSFADRGRLDGGDFTCCKPAFGSSTTASWNAAQCVTNHCPTLTLEALPSPNTSSSNCGSVLYFDVYVSSTQNANLSDVRFALKVKKNGTFSLNSTLSYSPYCTPASCLTVTEISADYLRVEFTTTLPNVMLFAPPSPNSSKLLVSVALNTSNNGCIDGITFLDAVTHQTGATDPCLTEVESQLLNSVSSDDICSLGHIFEVSAETEAGAKIAEWYWYVDYKSSASFPNCQYNGDSPDGTTISQCVCILTNPAEEQNVVLKKADNYLNGVSTYDLVLISRHAVGVQALPNFKLLAADANMSGSVTSFDIVELRRLILGIYQSLPNSNSWRFIDKDLMPTIQNPNTSNPFTVLGTISTYGTSAPFIPIPNAFALEEFDEFALPPSTNPVLDSKAEFVGFKVGDVNGNAIPAINQPQMEDRGAGFLSVGAQSVKGRAGETVEIPVFSLEQASLAGWQLALQFDTTLLQVTGVRWPAGIPAGAAQDRGWHLARPGELRVLWFNGEGATTVAVGTPLFFVQAQLRQDMRNRPSILQLAPGSGSIPSEAYDGQLQHYALQLETSEAPLLSRPAAVETMAQPAYKLSAYPNPAGTHFRLEIEASAAAAARLDIRDLLGRPVATRRLDLAPGMNTVAAAQLPALAPGQYIISLYTSTGVETLRLVKH